jgi:hypothetical protein
MGMESDSDMSEVDQNNINITQDSVAAVIDDVDVDNERDPKSGPSLRCVSTKNSINLKESDIDSDEDSAL